MSNWIFDLLRAKGSLRTRLHNVAMYHDSRALDFLAAARLKPGLKRRMAYLRKQRELNAYHCSEARWQNRHHIADQMRDES